MKGWEGLRNGTLSSDGASSPGPRTAAVYEGLSETFPWPHKQGLTECKGVPWLGEEATFTHPWLRASEGQIRMAGREGVQEAKQTRGQDPPLFAVFFYPTASQEE